MEPNVVDVDGAPVAADLESTPLGGGQQGAGGECPRAAVERPLAADKLPRAGGEWAQLQWDTVEGPLVGESTMAVEYTSVAGDLRDFRNEYVSLGHATQT